MTWGGQVDLKYIIMEQKTLVQGALMVVALLVIAPYVTPESFYFKDDSSPSPLNPDMTFSALQLVLLAGVGYVVAKRM